MAKLLDDCFRPGKQRLRHAEALEILKAHVRVVTGTERLEVGNACGRIIAEPVRAPRPIPAHTNAAVDGYAFAYRAHDNTQGSQLKLAGRAAAGHPIEGNVPAGWCVRIFTGAVLPEGCDTVVMQEDVETSGAGGDLRVGIPPGLKAGANRRLAGEDVPLGHELFAPGTRLRPQDVAALAAAGCAEVLCHKQLEVAVLSSGDEVVPPGAELRPGQVYDANAPMLGGLIGSCGATHRFLGIWPDDPDLIRSRLAEAARTHSVIIASGGASMGEEDHMVRALESLGSCHLWQLAIKPGRPMSFGQIRTGTGDCVFVGLPGNPVAVFVCFLMYVRPLLAALGGETWSEPRRYKMRAAFDFKGRKPGRREFWRGMFKAADGGGFLVDKFPRDGSGLISGLRAADGLIEIAEEQGDIAVGDDVDFIPFSEFGIVG